MMKILALSDVTFARSLGLLHSQALDLIKYMHLSLDIPKSIAME